MAPRTRRAQQALRNTQMEAINNNVILEHPTNNLPNQTKQGKWSRWSNWEQRKATRLATNCVFYPGYGGAASILDPDAQHFLDSTFEDPPVEDEEDWIDDDQELTPLAQGSTTRMAEVRALRDLHGNWTLWSTTSATVPRPRDNLHHDGLVSSQHDQAVSFTFIAMPSLGCFSAWPLRAAMHMRLVNDRNTHMQGYLTSERRSKKLQCTIISGTHGHGHNKDIALFVQNQLSSYNYTFRSHPSNGGKAPFATWYKYLFQQTEDDGETTYEVPILMVALVATRPQQHSLTNSGWTIWSFPLYDGQNLFQSKVFPDGLGSAQFWLRTPSYTEFLADKSSRLTWAGASQFARALPELTPFLLSSPLSSLPAYYEHVITTNRMDLGLWVSSDGKALVIAVNFNYFPATINSDLDEILSATQFQDLALENPRLVVDGGAKIEGTQIKFYGAVLSGAWVFG
ncbi:hypothetical protein EI94DRAFT_1709119 [Lactarius quietus]|nr:hypothetical protein EI94DRAFT_1709119 [Lactarius quietus]